MANEPGMLRVAAVQASPVFLDREATVEKACGLIEEAGRKGAQIIAFPESFIPAYPDWVWAVPAGQDERLSALYEVFLENAVDVPGPATHRIGEAARAAGAYVVMGVSERNSEASSGSLFNTLLYFSPDGNLLGKHRKLVPTGGERLVWAQGGGSTLDVYATPLGRLSGLICWENYMPLARYALYAWGVQIYVAATWDRGEPWLSTLRHIAKEGRMLVLGCGMALRKSDIPERFDLANFYQDSGEWINTGGSAIVSPRGDFLAGPLNEEEGILLAEVNLPLQQGSRWMFDAAGHYARPDVFELIVHRQPHPLIREIEEQ
jgi:nitrilase